MEEQTETRATNVVEALARVMRDLPGIGKDQQASKEQGGYAYRGIEAVTREVQPLLARHGVVFAPRVLSMEFRDLTINNKPWTDTILTVAYTVRGPGGVDDAIEVVVAGIGRDNSDKGANKALTQSFKYALLQVLCVSDSNDDADGTTHEADARGANADGYVITKDSEVGVELVALAKDTPDPKAFAEWVKSQGTKLAWPLDEAGAEAWRTEAQRRIALGKALDQADGHLPDTDDPERPYA